MTKAFQEPTAPSEFVSGFVSILGPPNAGKSTLLNRLVGTKVAIVAEKPQTTRQSLQGVVNRPGAQVVFLDTPGIHKPRSRLNQLMMEEVEEALRERDLLLLLVDATKTFGPGDQFAIECLRKSPTPSFLALNKIDLLREKKVLLPLMDHYQNLHSFREIVPVSALTGDNVEHLLSTILRHLPQGPPYFPPDHITDLPARFLAAEIIREKIILLTRQEVPYAAAVLVNDFEKTTGLLRIHATAFVEREGQKGILIGARGEMLKKIGSLARKELEQTFDGKVYLELFVKVRENWRESPGFLKGLDWRKMVGAEDQSSAGEA